MDFELSERAANAGEVDPQDDGSVGDAATTCAASTARQAYPYELYASLDRDGPHAHAVSGGARRARRQRARHGDHRRGTRAQELRFLHRLRRERILRLESAAQRHAGAVRALSAEAHRRRNPHVRVDVGTRRRLGHRRHAQHARGAMARAGASTGRSCGRPAPAPATP